MFNPSQNDVRLFFFDTFAKGNNHEELSALEAATYSIILEHKEYHHVLANKAKYLDYQWHVTSGETNPFLHLSMHLTIFEQLTIDQPFKIRELFKQMCSKFGDRHTAEHNLIDCLGEMLYLAEKNASAPDINVYFACIHSKLKGK